MTPRPMAVEDVDAKAQEARRTATAVGWRVHDVVVEIERGDGGPSRA